MGYEIDFLPVGEGQCSGDAIALRFGDLFQGRQRVVVIDGGFEESGRRLVEHVLQNYRTQRVDLVVSTHPDADHIGGLQVILDELSIGHLWMHRPWLHELDVARLFRDGRVTDQSVREALRRSLEAARSLEQAANRKGIPITEPFADVTFENGCLTVLGPTCSFYEELLSDFRSTPRPQLERLLRQLLGAGGELLSSLFETWDIETLDDSGETTAENNSSTILLFEFENRRHLFTADAGIPALTDVAERLGWYGGVPDLNFIQVTHHGSRRNVGPEILDRLVGPRLSTDEHRVTAYISAAVDGEPKHPSRRVTNAFRRRGARVYATKGSSLLYRHDAPPRDGWGPAEALPFYHEVEAVGEATAAGSMAASVL